MIPHFAYVSRQSISFRFPSLLVETKALKNRHLLVILLIQRRAPHESHWVDSPNPPNAHRTCAIFPAMLGRFQGDFYGA